MPNKFENLKALAEKATPGPWTATPRGRDFDQHDDITGPNGVRIANCYGDKQFDPWKANNAYIAAVDPQTVLGLLEKVDELECTLSDEEASHQETLAQVEVLKDRCRAALSFIENMTCPQTTADVALLLLKGAPVIDGLRDALSPAQQSNPVPVENATA